MRDFVLLKNINSVRNFLLRNDVQICGGKIQYLQPRKQSKATAAQKQKEFKLWYKYLYPRFQENGWACFRNICIILAAYLLHIMKSFVNLHANDVIWLIYKLGSKVKIFMQITKTSTNN